MTIENDFTNSIREIIESFNSRIKEYHKLRTRKAGNMRHIDFHLLLDKSLTIDEAHALCEEIEKEIEEKIKNTSVIIHIEPYETSKSKS